jgi:serine/threonine protein kinase
MTHSLNHIRLLYIGRYTQQAAVTLFKSTPHEHCTKDSLHNVWHELHFHTVVHPRRLDIILHFLLILFPQMQNVCFVCYSLCCTLPFEKIDNVKREVLFPQRCWTTITGSVKDLIKSMLKHDPKERIDLNMILSHPWLKVWTVHCYSYYKCKWIVQNKYKIISMLNKHYISTVHGELLCSCTTLVLNDLFNNVVIC